MPTLPIILPAGSIAIYGWGYDTSNSGIVPDNTAFKFGTIYQIWDGGATYIYGGDEVMWTGGTEQCKLAYSGNPYTIVKARLVTKQIIAP